ncbi:MAG: zf-HC2 domain-containing protein [Thermoanaerobaculia bacterium]
MTCRETSERLHDLLDGRLDADERRRVREHLAGCLDCSRELAGLRRLLDRAADLPGIAPRRDLWPAIRERIRPSETPVAPPAPATPRADRLPSWWPLAAAAVLAVAILLSRLATTVEPVEAKADADSPRTLLSQTLDERRAELPPDSVAAFEADLQVLDRAILEIEGALEASPENRRLRLLLAERRQQEAELLKLLARA